MNEKLTKILSKMSSKELETLSRKAGIVPFQVGVTKRVLRKVPKMVPHKYICKVCDSERVVDREVFTVNASPGPQVFFVQRCDNCRSYLLGLTVERLVEIILSPFSDKRGM